MFGRVPKTPRRSQDTDELGLLAVQRMDPHRHIALASQHGIEQMVLEKKKQEMMKRFTSHTGMHRNAAGYPGTRVESGWPSPVLLPAQASHYLIQCKCQCRGIYIFACYCPANRC